MHGFCKAMRKREITAKFKFAKNIGENEKNRYYIEATILPCAILIPEGRSALLLVIIITYRTPFVNTLSWKACKTFSLFFVHHAHYLTKTIFIFSAFNQISTLCSPPLSGATYYAFPLGKGNRRQAVVGFPTEIFFLHVSVLCQRQHFHSQKAPPTAIPGSKSAPQIFSLISKQIPEW